MSFMTTNMFALRIWGFDPTSAQTRIALGAGWRRSDILWEGLMEGGNVAWLAGDIPLAARLFRRAFWVAKLTFARSDLRHAAAQANLGMIARRQGRSARATAHFKRAGQVWDAHAADAIALMTIAPRARSSLFHLRMEARHRETYHDNFRLRLSRIGGEVRASLDCLERGKKPTCRLYTRWRGERPNVYDDTRKVLGACLLIAEPQG
ncbi:tetratricopeptide repeat protein [Rhodobacteraceae bacterium KMM 6894]|nr:tetratricopeptide repeat protein [Rhodobacteraceae bacterium KMM 6894]